MGFRSCWYSSLAYFTGGLAGNLWRPCEGSIGSGPEKRGADLSPRPRCGYRLSRLAWQDYYGPAHNVRGDSKRVPVGTVSSASVPSRDEEGRLNENFLLVIINGFRCAVSF
jgi:hypothetical protein